MRKFIIVLSSILLNFTFAFTQNGEKKTLQHEDVSTWNTINNSQLSANGNWASYVLSPIEGDKSVYWHNLKNNTKSHYTRGERPTFSSNGQFLFFTIKSAKDSIRYWKLNKISKKKWPEDTLAIVNLSSGSIHKIPHIKSYAIGKKWMNHIALHLTPKGSTKEGEKEPKHGTLQIYKLADQKAAFEIGNATSYKIADDKEAVAFIQKNESYNVGIANAETPGTTYVWQDSLEAQKLAVSNDGTTAAFLAPTKDDKELFQLFCSDEGKQAQLVLTTNNSIIPENWHLSKNRNLSFSPKGDQLFFGIAPKLAEAPEGVLEEEQANVEVWHYQDERIYPQQKVSLKRDRQKTYPCIYHVDKDKLVPLGSLDIPNVRVSNDQKGDWLIGYNDKPYLVQTTWEGGPSHKEVFLINKNTGESKQIASKVRGTGNLSPEGKYVYWYSYPDSSWFVYNIAKETTTNITEKIGVAFYDEINDRPNYPSPYGSPGWTTNDDFIVLYDRYDIWLIDPNGSIKPLNPLKGRADKIIHRYVKYDRDEKAIEEVKPMLIHFTNEETREEGYMWFNIHTGVKEVLQKGPYSFMRRPIKAKNAEQWLFSKADYNTFPNLIASKDLKVGSTISDANPQQADFKWGNIKHVKWTSIDGQELTGLLAVPEDFDPNKKYPMIVNFYERNSQRLYNHRAPSFNRSQIVYSFYTSRGYIIFNPDIPYRVGYPGESAFNAVVSGTTHLIDQGFVDKDRIGIQGHSWGGYQIAHIITKTDLFKCAEAGAPVVNMFSAYGGIRWGSGISRMFQYEHTQSRIGGTIWDYPIRYLENSPIFFADKVNTPVLILHNDNDGAVPWYQGIEFYMAMRRLNKPAWMLNYNNEPHWPLKLPNRKDFQKRMQQFFDYYLMDAPMPEWMANGVPAINKKTDTGFSPVTDKQ